MRELEIAPAHVIGASMGGMIAQTLAARYPSKVRSLVSIMSNTGSIRSGQPALRVYPIFLRRPPREREAFIAHMERVFAAIGSPGLPRDPQDMRTTAGLSYDRGRDPAGPGRQLAAIIAAGDRTSELRLITTPTLVIHGTADPLIAPSGGRATARAIPGARRRGRQKGRPCPCRPVPRRGPAAVGQGLPPLAPARPAAAHAQTQHRVRARAGTPASLGLHPHEPVQVVPAVRAPVRPAAVERAEHPVLLTSERSHPHIPSIPARFISQSFVSRSTRSRILLDLKRIIQSLHPVGGAYPTGDI
jgi:hypothetical protein